MTGWADAVQAADELQAEHPDWRVRAVPRRDGPGVAATRDGNGLCSVTGTPEEIGVVLDAEDYGEPDRAVAPSTTADEDFD